jgi:hypothetical protein
VHQREARAVVTVFRPREHHITRNGETTRLCDGQPAGENGLSTLDLQALREARAEATLCPLCQQASGHPAFTLQPQLYNQGSRTLAHLYTVPVRYDFDRIRNCPHCRENPSDRTRQAWPQVRKGVGVLHREARRIPKDVTELRDSTGGSAATLYQFVNGSIAYFTLAAPPWREAGEVTGKAQEKALQVLEVQGIPGGHPHRRHDAGTTRTHGGNCGGSASRSGSSF